MLGLALNGAKRGEEYGLRLQKSSQLRNPAKPAAPKDIRTEDPIEKATQKRNRRRRRSKKPLNSQLSQGSQGTFYPKILSKKPHDAPMTKRDLYFCLRCGVVVVGNQGMDSAVGRVVLVNWENETVFDKFVKVPLHVADYRTSETGITERDLSSPDAITFDQARKEVGRLIKGKILIGHGLEVDLASLGLTHPWSDIRDTATYSAYMKEISDLTTRMLLPQELAILSKNELNQDIGNGPISQATVCLELYKAARADWEAELIQLVQQTERQRQMVMSMRASGQGNSRINGISVPLSAIRENDALFQHSYRRGGPSLLYASSVNSGSQSGAYYHEDEVTSETSYISLDTDVLSSMSPNPVPEISDFGSSSQGRTSILSQQAQRDDVIICSERYITDSNTSPLFHKHQSRALEKNQGHAAASNSGGRCDGSSADIWGVLKPLGYVASPSQDSGFTETSGAATDSSKHEIPFWPSDSIEQYEPTIPVVNESKCHISEEEAELLRHLPSGLIADLDQDLDGFAYSNRMDVRESKEKCSIPWYRSRRKQKSFPDLGVRNTSASENIFVDSMRNGSLDNINCDELLTERKQPGIWFRSLRRHRTNSLPVQPLSQCSPFVEEGSVGSL